MNYTKKEKEALDAIKIVRAYMKNNLGLSEKNKFFKASTENSKKNFLLDNLLFDLQEEIIGKAEFR